MTEKSPIDLWASFLANHKLTPRRIEPMILVAFCELLAKTGVTPKIVPYSARLFSRRFVCKTAMDNGIDLMAWTHKGKPVMARSLLDMWNIVYKERYGSTYGTTGAREVVRREIKTRLSRKEN